MTDFKKEAAARAIAFLKNKKIIGLGAGATIAHIVELLRGVDADELPGKIVTSSFNTQQLLVNNGFNVTSINAVAEIDIYIDGCDQFDKNLNALKSGGGIHTREKLLASMAKEFILAGDETKYVTAFNSQFPLVVDVIPEALNFVIRRIGMIFPEATTILRLGDKKEGPVITDHGNYLLEISFKSWPELATLNSILKNITGIVETSLFFNLACKAIIAGNNGIQILDGP